MKFEGIKDFFAIEDKQYRKEHKDELKRSANLEVQRFDGMF